MKTHASLSVPVSMFPFPSVPTGRNRSCQYQGRLCAQTETRTLASVGDGELVTASGVTCDGRVLRIPRWKGEGESSRFPSPAKFHLTPRVKNSDCRTLAECAHCAARHLSVSEDGPSMMYPETDSSSYAGSLNWTCSRITPAVDDPTCAPS